MFDKILCIHVFSYKDYLIPDSQYWESQFLGRLIGSLGVPKGRGVWNSQGGKKDKHFFFLHIP